MEGVGMWLNGQRLGTLGLIFSIKLDTSGPSPQYTGWKQQWGQKFKVILGFKESQGKPELKETVLRIELNEAVENNSL